MDTKLLELLVCPASKGALIYMREQQELWCAVSQLAYPIKEYSGVYSLKADINWGQK